jgi:predicted dinucleotide-binding enzyme
MGSVVQLATYRRPRAEQAAVKRKIRAVEPASPSAPAEAEIVILPVVRIVRGELPPAGAAQG